MPTRTIPEIAQEMSDLLERQLELMKADSSLNERINKREYQTLQARLNELKDELQEACMLDHGAQSL